MVGLLDYNEKYLGYYQVMRFPKNCAITTYRAGDLNGLRWGVEGPPVANDNLVVANPVCPWHGSTLFVNNWFAASEIGEPAHAGVGPFRSVWFRWTAVIGWRDHDKNTTKPL